MDNYRVAIVQVPSVHLDLKGSVEKALDIISDTGKENLDLMVFGESWFPGYPAWLDYCTNVAEWNGQAMKRVFARMLENSIRQDSPEMRLLRKAAKDMKMSLVFGGNEVDKKVGKGTIFNSLFFIDNLGKLLNTHRKLVPTFTEKLVHSPGDGNGLKSSILSGIETTGAICWEHWMPLTRQSLHDSGEKIHVAAWPKVHEMHRVASRQYAFEGRCFVIAAGQMLHSSEFPKELEKPEYLEKQDNWVLNGGSCVIKPNGEYLIEPQFDKEEIIIANLDLNQIAEESLTLDTSGHYQRHDVFDFKVNKTR